MLKDMAYCFSAGCVGALANSLTVWLAGITGLTLALGVGIAPSLTPEWLYPRLIWGGIWGFLFLLPIMRLTPYVRGLLFSLGPTLVQLLIVFPLVKHKGMLGLQIGLLTPFFVLVFNAVWGWVTTMMLIRLRDQ
ncbi:MAG: hypothetical protein D6698_08225 [Gammaproteobacteria bacterium]|nr:MAG: hypothetical protein D6698_08225 [Gammaproteobacteria bacterium]